MPSRIATFEKVSFSQFQKDWSEKIEQLFSNEEMRRIYDGIKIPQRGTAGSAGYDIFAPVNIRVRFGKACVIPTGLRCRIEEGWFLDLNPRSGMGFQYGIRLANTRGIIDSDYYGADNEGHIMIKIVNDAAWSGADFFIPSGKAFAQGIFTIYGITTYDEAKNARTNGFGSTDNK